MVSCDFNDQVWLIRASGSDKETQTLINPLNGSIEERKIPEMEGQMCLAHFEEWLFLVSDVTDDCFLLNIYSLKKISLPSIDEESFQSLGLCTLTSSPTSPDCIIIFFGEEDNFLFFCHPGDKEWTELPVDLDVTHVKTMLKYKEKLYVVLLNSIEIIDIASLSTGVGTTHVKTISMDKPEHFFSFGIGRLGNLVESCGDIFFVRTCFPGPTQTVIDLDIFKFEETKTDWERVESIGDCAFFLDSHGKGGQSFHAQDARVDWNCVYQMLSCYDGKRLYKICLDNQTLSFKLLSEEAIQGQYYGFFNWLLPMRQPVLKPELCISSYTNACSTENLNSNEPSRLLFSKDGWALALQGYNQLCLLNPFTNDFLHLPILEYPYSYDGIAMSCAPNSLSCVVFALVGQPRGEFTKIIAWHYGQDEWYQMEFHNNCSFPVADNNPVFIDGEFYCLSRLGSLGVFNPKNNTWRILDKLSHIYSDLD
ncbi:F-box/kelch-repeat protein [Carex littledalei]|uniref:F-box/kelch-repeat protein n=1 Tax=Carex littledalei TaxID=544730 RepID=A0A833R613_9POAL|nr:F-box/kelch-repeat protein [Carex littledalei]